MSIRLDASRTSRSRAREDELVAMATPVVIDNPELFMQARRAQSTSRSTIHSSSFHDPNAMEMMRMMLEHMNKQASEHSSQIASLAALVKQNASTQQAPVQTMNRSAIGSDVQSIMNLTDRDHQGSRQSDMATRAWIDSSTIHHESIQDLLHPASSLQGRSFHR
jgi:enoyl reductase-like protein